jgi:outer membrane protein assembly factor BamE (lipoprotein component of BamABCDE complex)
MWDAGSATDKEDFRRHRIADGLVASRELIGRTREQVIELLGTPANSGRQNVLEYVLGEDRGSYFKVDPEVLTIEFAADGRASRAYTRGS